MDKRFNPLVWLQQAGHPAYLVGNQARNHLLGNDFDPKDIDIATPALPERVAGVLRRKGILPVHLDKTFGVVTFQWLGNSYEVTTFRRDIYDEEFDHIRRTPTEIIFIDDLIEDARRRDFTINAIYWDPVTDEIIDPLRGRLDLKKKILRLIGDAERRLKEDPLRILRAIRFKYDLGLRYDLATAQALRKRASLIHKLPLSVIKREFQKIQDLARYPLARREMQRLKIVPRG